MSRNAHNRALLTLIAVLFALWTTWATVVLPQLPKVQGTAHTLQSVGIRLLLWVLPCGVYLWVRYRRRALSGLRLGLPPSGRHWLLAGFVIVAAGLAVSLDVARKLDVTPAVVWQRLVTEFEFALPLGELFEELIFRSVILSELLALSGAEDPARASRLSQRQRAWMSNLGASMVFTGLHWPWWIYTVGMGVVFWMNSAGVFLISLVLGVLFIRSRSVWPCVVLHWLNNALSALANG